LAVAITFFVMLIATYLAVVWAAERRLRAGGPPTMASAGRPCTRRAANRFARIGGVISTNDPLRERFPATSNGSIAARTM